MAIAEPAGLVEQLFQKEIQFDVNELHILSPSARASAPLSQRNQAFQSSSFLQF